MAIKAQALADFIVESTHETTPPEVESPKEQSSNEDLARWILFIDGSSNQHDCGSGLIIQTPSGEQMEYAIRIGFKATNNEAEFETLLAGLKVAVELGAEFLDVFSDSQLVGSGWVRFFCVGSGRVSGRVEVLDNPKSYYP